MKQVSELHGLEQVNELGTDFRAEVVAACLVDKGYDPEELFILREGAGRRGVAKDIARLRINYNSSESSESDTPMLHIHTNRSGIYDTLPEGMFHTSRVAGRRRSKEVVLDEIRRHRQEEFYVRRFLRLFEVESDRNLILAQFWELRFDKKYAYGDFVEIFACGWPFLQKLPPHSAVSFVRLVPYIHLIRNSYDQVAQAMSLVLGTPVSIAVEHETTPATRNRSTLGSMKLGRSFATAGSEESRDQALLITVGPVSHDRTGWFTRADQGGAVLEALADIFLQADVSHRYEVKMEQARKHFRIGSAQRIYLGINTQL